MSDRIAVMNKGRIAQVATPEGIYERPSDGFVADFIGETNFFSGIISKTESGNLVLETDAGIRLRLAGLTDSQNGRSIGVALRPEKLFIRTTDEESGYDKDAGSVRFGGPIEDVIYLGDICKYVIRVGNQRVICKELISAGHERRLPGQYVDLGWLDQDVQVL